VLLMCTAVCSLWTNLACASASPQTCVYQPYTNQIACACDTLTTPNTNGLCVPKSCEWGGALRIQCMRDTALPHSCADILTANSSATTGAYTIYTTPCTIPQLCALNAQCYFNTSLNGQVVPTGGWQVSMCLAV
jgi:hypothetical protein